MTARHQLMGHSITLLTYLIAFLMFFPILWMVMTSFKTEAVAFAYPPRLLFKPTLTNWDNALFDTSFREYLVNTLIITGVSTFFVLSIGIPTAYNLAFFSGETQKFHALMADLYAYAPPGGSNCSVFCDFPRLEPVRPASWPDHHLHSDESSACSLDDPVIPVGFALRNHRGLSYGWSHTISRTAACCRPID